MGLIPSSLSTFFFFENTHTPLNYLQIVNIYPKLLIVSIPPHPPNQQKNANVPPKANKKTQITLKKFQ